jgi:hypothetical protein
MIFIIKKSPLTEFGLEFFYRPGISELKDLIRY